MQSFHLLLKPKITNPELIVYSESNFFEEVRQKANLISNDLKRSYGIHLLDEAQSSFENAKLMLNAKNIWKYGAVFVDNLPKTKEVQLLSKFIKKYNIMKLRRIFGNICNLFKKKRVQNLPWKEIKLFALEETIFDLNGLFEIAANFVFNNQKQVIQDQKKVQNAIQLDFYLRQIQSKPKKIVFPARKSKRRIISVPSELQVFDSKSTSILEVFKIATNGIDSDYEQREMLLFNFWKDFFDEESFSKHEYTRQLRPSLIAEICFIIPRDYNHNSRFNTL